MEIILIRHAQSKGNEIGTVQGQSDTGLSDLGKEQAKKLASYFREDYFNAIYSSNLIRAKETAQPTAKKLRVEIITDQELREANFGIWEGLSYAEIEEKYKKEYADWLKNYIVRPPWFESFSNHQIRIRKAIEKILRTQNKSKRVAVFTHGGSIKTQIGYFLKLNGEELAGFANKNCSLTLIEFNSSSNYEDGRLIYYNKEVI